MNTLKSSVATVIGLIVLMPPLTFTDGALVAAQGPTSVSADDHVQLDYVGSASSLCPSGTVPVARVSRDGSYVPNFAVPPGKVLVITDLDGLIRPDVPWTSGNIGSLSAGIQVGSITRTILSAYAPLTAATVSAGIVSMSVHSQAGVLFGPNVRVCLFATQIFPNGGSRSQVSRAKLQGYLIPD
jgi:hypothetical protein